MNNPLRLLFLGNGLPVLSSMYQGPDKGDTQIGGELKCSKSSWVYNSLGRYLHSQLGAFKLSDELIGRINSQPLDLVLGVKSDSSKLMSRMHRLGYTNACVIGDLASYRHA